MLHFLYTGEIRFALFSWGSRLQLPAQARTGDWSKAKLPSPSAKSIYRLADMVIGLNCFWRPSSSSFLVRYTNPQATGYGVHT